MIESQFKAEDKAQDKDSYKQRDKNNHLFDEYSHSTNTSPEESKIIESPYKACFQRILAHKRKHNLPHLQSMNVEDMTQLRKLIKVELVHLKLQTQNETVVIIIL